MTVIVMTTVQKEVKELSKKSDQDNHANYCNRNNDAYWQSRGEEERPEDWEDKAKD